MKKPAEALPPRALAFSVPEACRLTGLKQSHFYELLASGDIRAVKVGRRTLVPRDALEEFISRLPAWAPATAAAE